MSDLDNLPPVDPKTGEVIINPLKEDGSPKTPKEIEKEKKKAEKLLKFAAKQAKKMLLPPQVHLKRNLRKRRKLSQSLNLLTKLFQVRKNLSILG